MEKFLAVYEYNLPNQKCRDIIIQHRSEEFMRAENIRPDNSLAVAELSNPSRPTVSTEFDKKVAIERLRNIMPADAYEELSREMKQIAHELFLESKKEGRPETSMVIFRSFEKLENLCYDVTARTPDLTLLASLDSDDAIVGTGPPFTASQRSRSTVH